MTEQTAPSQEFLKFIQKIRMPHRRINPCFMTGKGCVHTEHIDSELEKRNNILAGFNVRPFQPNIEAAHILSLYRFLYSNYSTNDCKLFMSEADKVRRTGYVVCEKICRRIQSSDFIIVDISAPNANVFYELGMAYGIDQKIIVIFQENSDFGRKAASRLQEGGCRSFAYRDLDPIRPEDFVLSNYLWTRNAITSQNIRNSPTIALITQTYGFLSWNSPKLQQKAAPVSSREQDVSLIDAYLGSSDIYLGFETHVKAAVGVAVDNIVQNLLESPPGAIMQKYISLVTGLKSTDQIKKDAGFQEVRQKIEQAFCTIIQTGGTVSDPMAYFWLGYCHALGKNVIPVTVIDDPNDDIEDLAFDLRALWHMSFIRKDPTRFSYELEETLQQMISSDFSEWSRRQFWDEVLGRRGKVSIFTGALHNEPIGREMIGDWDLRAASEMTSYLASHQYRATIESPVYQIEQVTSSIGKKMGSVTEDEYILELGQMLRNKNCIVIASPDVNPLTELLLGKLYDVDQREWFKSGKNIENRTGSVIAFKELNVLLDKTDNTESQKEVKKYRIPDITRSFYRQVTKQRMKNNPDQLKRGFIGHGVPGGRIEGAFLCQTDEKSPFNVHAHLVVARNPFDEDSLERHHVIILNGVSGPATFALTHVLTGGTSNQFVAYADDFLPETKSEAFLQNLNQDLEMLEDRFLGLQYFFLVEVGPASEKQEEKSNSVRDIFDWRRIIRWERVALSTDCAFGQNTAKKSKD